MKKYNIIFPALFLTLTTMPTCVFADNYNPRTSQADSDAIQDYLLKNQHELEQPAAKKTSTTTTVSGIIIDDMGEPAISATIYKIDSDGKAQAIAKADMDGRFKVDNFDGTKLKITNVGTADQIVEPGENLDIKLVASKRTTLDDVNVTKKHQEGDTCGAVLIKDDNANKEAKGKYKKVNNEWVCTPNECIQDYELKNNTCVHKVCTNQEKKDLNATEAEYKGGKCIPTECKNKYHLENGNCVENKCPTDEEDWDGTKCVKVRCNPNDLSAINAKYGDWDAENGKCIATDCIDTKNFKLSNGTCIANDCPTKELEKLRATKGHMENDKCIPETCLENYTLDKEKATCTNADILAEKQKAYDDAKAKEQSTENKLLGGLSTAATGIGGMELMQGLAEQSSDKDAAADMAAYIETMRCTYGDGKQVKAGPEEIELPGANDSELMKLRSEYLALAADLKERKEALGLKPGIESEVIVDRTQTGLYDDENIGISGGNYGSLYRAQMLNSESDQAKIADEKSISSNRVKGGAIAAGAGVVVGVAGNSLINGKLGEMLKSKKSKTEAEKLLEKEADALKDLQSCLKDAGVKDTDKLEFANFYPSVLTVKNMKCKNIKLKIKDVKASDIFADSTDEDEIFDSMNKYFDTETISKMVGFTKTENENNIKNEIKSAISEKQKEIAETKKKDTEQKESKSKDSSGGIDIGNILDNVDINDIKEKAGSLLG